MTVFAVPQKGTGKWTAISALDKGIPVTLIGQSHTRTHTHNTHTDRQTDTHWQTDRQTHTTHTQTDRQTQTDTHTHTHNTHTHTFPPSIPPLLFSAGESVFARCLSSLKEERTQASKILKGPSSKFQEDKKAFVEHVRKVSGSCHTARGVQLSLADVSSFSSSQSCQRLASCPGSIVHDWLQRQILWHDSLSYFMSLHCPNGVTILAYGYEKQRSS